MQHRVSLPLAALYHDAREDRNVSFDHFTCNYWSIGSYVSFLVEGVTKPTKDDVQEFFATSTLTHERLTETTLCNEMEAANLL